MEPGPDQLHLSAIRAESLPNPLKLAFSLRGSVQPTSTTGVVATGQADGDHLPRPSYASRVETSWSRYNVKTSFQATEGNNNSSCDLSPSLSTPQERPLHSIRKSRRSEENQLLIYV